MLTNINYELKKIFLRKKFLNIIILEMILTAALLVFLFLNDRFSIVLPDMNEPTMFIFKIPNISFVMLSLLFTTILPLTIFMLVSDNISLEFDNNTIKNILLRPASRFKIYTSKLLAFFIYIIINLMAIFLVMLIVKLAFGQDLRTEIQAFFAFLLTAYPMATLICFSAFIAVNLKSSSMTMFILTAIYIGTGLLSLVSTNLRSVLFVNYLSFYKIIFTSSFALIINVTFLLLSIGVIFFILGNMSFDKKNV